MISGRARLAGIVGWPVSHSRSPLLHNHWLAQYGIDGAYVPLAVRPEDISRAITGLRAAGFAGVNVTIPHKEAAAALCDDLDESAAQTGAANTLVFGSRGVRGLNTDGAGFMANLEAHGVAASGPALVLGAGGAARAVAAALLGAGARVAITNRSPVRAQALARALPGLGVLPWEHRAAALADQALLVNTTAAGMHGRDELLLDLHCASPALVVADIVYVPLLTPLLARANAAGLRTVPGLGMLLHQAVPGFSAWFGTVPVVDQACFDLLSADIAGA
jgi:shikimate dehydrogenase